MTGVTKACYISYFNRSVLILKRKPFWLQIAIFFFLSIFISILTAPFIWITDNYLKDGDAGPGTESFITILVIAPILETYLFQHMTYKLFQSISATRYNYLFYIILSSLIFGSLHTYSVSYVLYAFTLGLMLSSIYIFYSKKPKTAFWSTAFIHFSRNLLATLLSNYDI